MNLARKSVILASKSLISTTLPEAIIKLLVFALSGLRNGLIKLKILTVVYWLMTQNLISTYVVADAGQHVV